MRILVAGTAGSTGFHLIRRLLTGCLPSTPVSIGIAAFYAWYKSYHGLD